MDKKIEFAKILSNSIEDDTEEVNKETKLDLIDSLIKDVDLRKNYNSRFNFYINFIKMFQKNSNIIKDFDLLAPSIVNEKDKNYGYFENKTISKKNKNNPFEVDFIKGFAMFFNKKKLNKIY